MLSKPTRNYAALEEETTSPFHKDGFICLDECLFKKCCKKYKRKGKHCRKCPKL